LAGFGRFTKFGYNVTIPASVSDVEEFSFEIAPVLGKYPGDKRELLAQKNPSCLLPDMTLQPKATIIQFVHDYEDVRILPKIHHYKCGELVVHARACYHPLRKVRFPVDIFEKIKVQKTLSKPLCRSRVHAQCTKPCELVYDQQV
jgi:hypothetical protein